MPIKKGSVFYQAMILTFAGTALQILFFIYRIIITRLSGAGGLGVYQLAVPFYSIVSSICLSGITMAVTRISVESEAENDLPKTSRLVSTSTRTFVVLLALLTVFTYLFPDIVAGKILGDIRTRGAIIMFIPCLFFTGFENIYKSFFYGMKHIKPNIISETTEICLRIALIFLLLTFNKPLTPEKTAFLIVLAMTISEVFSFTFLSVCYRNYKAKNITDIKGIKKRRYPTLPYELAKIAVPISASSLFMNILGSVNTVLIPQRLVASGLTQEKAVEMLGVISGMVSPIVTLPGIFIGPLANVILPRITKSMKLGNDEDTHNKIAKTLMTCSFLTFPAMGIIAAIGKPLCLLMYRNEAAAEFILPFLLSSGFVFFQIITNSILYALNKQKHAMVYNVIDGLIHILFTYFAVPHFGIYGYMFGHFASSFVGAMLNIGTIIKYTKIKIAPFKWFGLPLLSGIYTSFMTHSIYNIGVKLSMNVLLSLIISVIFGFIIYIALLELQNISAVRYLKKLRV